MSVVRGLEAGDPPCIGPYRLVGRLGGGGMGRVYLGMSAGGRPVAVKVVRAELAADLEFRVRFGREVAAARRVSGLFTALVVDADVDGPVPWLATAYVPGPALSEAVAASGPMPARQALVLAAGLAEGLGAIHAAGVVHCDLKPANVLLSPDGPRVIDFGISRAAEAVPGAGAGLMVGSPGFMSPEQAMGLAVGPPSDIFSLGAVLTFAATGAGPFGRGSNPELAYRLVYSPPSLELLPAELRPLVLRCLAKDPGQRPTAAEVLDEVGAAQPVTGWLHDPAAGAFARYLDAGAAGYAAARADQAAPPRSARRAPSSWRRVWRPLAAAAVVASVLGASVMVSFMLSNASQHSTADQVVRGTTTQAPVPARQASSPPVIPATAPASPAPTRTSRPPRAAPVPAIVPAVATVSSTPSASPSASPSPSPSFRTRASAPAASRRPSASPTQSSATSPADSPTATPPATASATASSPAPTPSPSSFVTSAPPVPQITNVGTYQQGPWVYFEIDYADPGQDAEGFGFMGIDGSRPVEGSFPFSSPGPGIVGPGSVAYPLDLKCGTEGEHDAEVQAWIYDTAGDSSQAMVIDLSCTD